MNKFIFIFIFLFPIFSQASSFEGNKKVYLVSAGGHLTQIGDIRFASEKDKAKYIFTLLDKPFENQFLSMRPFQCLMDVKQVMCYVPYPYEKKGYIVDGDLTDLSYDLLFLHKNPSEYGINMWNGIFYQLTKVGSDIEGVVFDIDMNILATPPKDLDNPISEDEKFEADLTNYVYPRILIK